MKGYRKLRVGEIIKEGDVGSDGDKLKTFFGNRCASDIYRPITKKAKKSSKFNLKENIEELVSYGCQSTMTENICRFIRRNYRRKE